MNTGEWNVFAVVLRCYWISSRQTFELKVKPCQSFIVLLAFILECRMLKNLHVFSLFFGNMLYADDDTDDDDVSQQDHNQLSRNHYETFF